MNQKIKEELDKGDQSPFCMAMLQHVKRLAAISRSAMSKYYDKFDRYDDTYRGKVYFEDTLKSKRATKRGHGLQEEEMVVPLAYAQVQTFKAFSYLLFTQRDTFFEVQAQGQEDEAGTAIVEALLQRDLNHSRWGSKLDQFLLDIGKFGLGVIKHSWVKETRKMQVQPMQAPSFAGEEVPKQMQDVTVFEGNTLINVSPYRWLPDTRIGSLARFQEGEFCGSELEMSVTSLQELESQGVYAGISQIKPYQTLDWQDRAKSTRFSSEEAAYVAPVNPGQSPGMCLVTEMQVKINPSKFQVDGQPLGEQDYLVPYVVVYANDRTLIKCEPLNYPHGKFTYSLGQYNPDENHLVNPGLMETVDMLQMVISWFITSHVASVQKMIGNKMVIDPTGVELQDIRENKSYIRLTQAAQGQDVRNFVYQLQLQDVTQAHMQDAQILEQMMQLVTSINDNALGQYNEGRRSATEARNVDLNATSRLKLIAQIIYEDALKPLAEMMLANHRDALSADTYVRVKGMGANPEEYSAVHVTRDQIAGNYDFAIFDATLPSEKGYLANNLQEILTGILTNPQAAMILGFDPKKLAAKIFWLRGMRNMDQFDLDPQQQAQMIAAQQQLNGPTSQPSGPGQPPGGTPAVPSQPTTPSLPF